MSKFKDHLKSVFLSIPLGIVIAILVCFLIAGYSIWYISAGKFPAFPNTGKDNYYIDLGEAFLHGQLSMLQKPNPQLIALKNPYGYQQRQNVPYQFDYSYYQGKYYLYWGPVPGLVLGGIEGLIHIRPPNALMSIICYIGLSFLLLIVLVQIRNQFFPAVPSLSLIIFIASGLVNLPFLFLLGRAEVYETSIIAGQFFLFLGLSSWMMYSGTGRSFWLVITGLSWGLALGSRYNLAISILLFIGFTIVSIGQEVQRNYFWSKLSLLLFPLALCVLGLGMYNMARFGNPLETGLTYQLTQPILHFYLTAYIPPNLYSYFFSPMTVINTFPFIKASLFSNAYLPIWLRSSAVASGKQFDPVMTGLVSSSPVTWLLVLGIPLAVLLGKSYLKRRPAFSRRFAFFAIILMAAAAQVLYLLIFFYGAMRYIADFYLLFILIVAMLVWRTDEIFQSKPKLRICFWMLVLALAIWTAGIGYFGGFDIPPRVFRNSNPVLYAHLASYWNNDYQSLKVIYNVLWIPKILHFVLHILG
jgi:hypothetical protein